MNVMLCTWQFPRWANGTQNVDPATYAFDDRNEGGGNLKALEFGVPSSQLGAEGYWGKWIHFLIQRYRKPTLVLEIMNEPNFQWWPQINSQGQRSAAYKAAEMMHTAASINAFYGAYIAAPAMSDTRRSSRVYTPYDTFAAGLKTALQSYNWRGVPSFIWTHHNYGDIERSEYLGYSAVYSRLSGWWQGWSPSGNTSGSDPGILITEGGCRMSEVSSPEAQAGRVSNLYQIMHFASGAAMFTNYLLHRDTTNSGSTGLLEYPGNPTRRPVWYSFRDMENNI
jgi:hypothetical protein